MSISFQFLLELLLSFDHILFFHICQIPDIKGFQIISYLLILSFFFFTKQSLILVKFNLSTLFSSGLSFLADV